MKIRLLNEKEYEEVADLVIKVFDEYEAAYYTDINKMAFKTAIRSKDYLPSLKIYGAFIEGKLVGVLATRNKGSHIALFFVDGKYHRQGIGRSLFNYMVEHDKPKSLTVHSSIYAESVYLKLGFKSVSGIMNEDGMKFIKMVKD